MTPVMSVDELQKFLIDAFPDSPPTTIVEDITATGARMRLPVTAVHGRPGGTVSGPTLMGLADQTAWLSLVGQIGPVALSVTTSLHIDFLRKPALVDVIAQGQILKLGRRLAVMDVAIWSDDEGGPHHLVAKAQVTYSIPPQ